MEETTTKRMPLVCCVCWESLGALWSCAGWWCLLDGELHLRGCWRSSLSSLHRASPPPFSKSFCHWGCSVCGYCPAGWDRWFTLAGINNGAGMKWERKRHCRQELSFAREHLALSSVTSVNEHKVAFRWQNCLNTWCHKEWFKDNSWEINILFIFVCLGFFCTLYSGWEHGSEKVPVFEWSLHSVSWGRSLFWTICWVVPALCSQTMMALISCLYSSSLAGSALNHSLV